jgi:hypothetical protein
MEDKKITLVRGVGHDIPLCCANCQHEDHEIGEFGSIICPSLCGLYIWLPYKKGTCKKQKQWPAKESEQIK